MDRGAVVVPFSFFDHTGDIGVRLSAPTLDGVFAAGADALFATLANPEEVQPRRSETVKVSAPDLDLLLVNWLNELHYRFETESLLVRRTVATVWREPDGWRLAGTIEGETFDAARHHINVLVKAVTYHGLKLIETSFGWEGQVIFDV